MAERELILEFSAYDLNRVLADAAGIRNYIPQRYAMEQLSAVVYDDPESRIAVAYKDVRDDEFWVTGHIPGMPLLPGVLICEAAAQLCAYQTRRHGAMEAEFMGFGGIDGVRFRGVVRPGDRLVIVTHQVSVRPNRMVRCRFQCFVNEAIVTEGEIVGVSIPITALQTDYDPNPSTKS